MILDVIAADYHDDKLAEQPTLSASIAKLLCTHSPLHAWAAHPRLNPNFKRHEDEKFDVGNVCHQIILEGRNAVSIVEANDWRSNDAKQMREEARAQGRIALLGKHWDEVDAMVQAAAAQLADHQAVPPLFTDGKPEQTIVWDEDGVVCRARLDWLRDDLAACDDLKTTSRSADPAAYAKNLYGVGGDVQAAMYVRGLKAVTGADVQFRWCVIETAPPYALSVISPGPDMLALGNAKVEYALTTWRRCLETGEWPGYPTRVATAELPAWEETRWLEKEAREAA